MVEKENKILEILLIFLVKRIMIVVLKIIGMVVMGFIVVLVYMVGLRSYFGIF